jgi:aryl-alcohol dehydrogenase-like predicted oxidoreductase
MQNENMNYFRFYKKNYMEYTSLGQTKIKVSKVCLGTMTFGEQNSESEGHQQMDYALDQGVNFFDTAELYAVPSNPNNSGKTEEIIGSWFKASGKRDQVILGTKITGPSANLKYIRDSLEYNREQINLAVDRSLGRLKTDYIDLYQLHWPERKANFFGKRGFQYDPDEGWEDNFLDILQCMQDLIDAGKVRHFGISNETPWGLMHFLQLAKKHKLPRCVSIQNPYNLLNRTFEIGLAEIAMREKAGLLAYSPMAFGLLSGKYHKGLAEEDARINKYHQMSRYNGKNTRQATTLYMEIAERHHLNMAQMALAFVHSRPFVTSTIIGATSMDQLKENIDSIYVELPSEVLKEMEAVHEDIPNPAP